MKDVQFYYIAENHKILYFDYINAYADLEQIAKSRVIPVPYFDGLEWIYNNRKFSIELKRAEVYEIWISRNKIFIHYLRKSIRFPAPDNLVVYTPTGEIERIISTPILPTGKKGGGIYQIGGEEVSSGIEDKTHLKVTVWEHEDSWWVYDYLMDIDTYEFVFKVKWSP